MELPEVITLCGVEYIKKSAAGEPQGGPEPVFTAAEVSEMSGVSIRRVYNLMDKGVLAYKVPNGCTRPRLVSLTDYETWIGLQ